jgi:hypothetical protein
MFEGGVLQLFDCLLQFLKDFGPTITAVIVTYIAVLQYRLSQANLKERLYDRRMAVFQAYKNALKEYLNGKLLMDDEAFKNQLLKEMLAAKVEAEFLFRKEVTDFLKKAGCSLMALSTCLKQQEILISSDSEMRNDKLTELGQQQKALEKECGRALGDLGKKFKHYLDFRKA